MSDKNCSKIDFIEKQEPFFWFQHVSPIAQTRDLHCRKSTCLSDDISHTYDRQTQISVFVTDVPKHYIRIEHILQCWMS